MIICFDIDFPTARPQDRRDGARMILAPSVDFASVADVRAASGGEFRAIENRVAMVKADVAWDSVIVAPTRCASSTPPPVHDERGGQALLVADVPLGPRGAPFTGSAACRSSG
jgi:apolipoprotein N-acyltransferase